MRVYYTHTLYDYSHHCEIERILFDFGICFSFFRVQNEIPTHSVFVHNTHIFFYSQKIVRITQVIKRSETAFVSYIYDVCVYLQKRVIHTVVYRPFLWQQIYVYWICVSVCVCVFHFVFISNKSYTQIVVWYRPWKICSLFSVFFNLDLCPFAIF